MKKITIAFTLVLGLMIFPLANAQDLKTQVFVDFKIRNLGINVDGFFKQSTINTNFKSEDLSQWALSGSVQTNSISTGMDKRDEHLLNEDYFDVKNYPEIYLEATSFKKKSENNYDVTVNLTIKKTTKTLTIPMEIIKETNTLKLKAYFEINRRDYDIGGGSLVLSNTAKINVNYTLIKY